MLRSAIDIGTEIQHVRVAIDRRQRRTDRRPVNTRQHLEHEAGNRHERTGIAGGHTGVGITGLDLVDGDPHRRIFLVAQGKRRRLVHANNFRGVNKANA